MLYSKRQMSDSFLIAALLAIVGGFLDAYTYVARGGVFANAQTGNIVLFGLHLAEGEWLHALSYFIPIAAFVLGIFIDEWIKKIVQPMPKIHWRQIVILFEVLMLFVVAWLPLG
ncbi:MAG: YoaK family protein, partial [Anaerotignum sp.]